MVNNALQDLLTSQPAVLIGLIANFTGCALQDDIAMAMRRMQQLGLILSIIKEAAMVQKHPIYPERIRKVPKQFSWLDQRLVRAHLIDRLSHPAAALYLFLVIVADAKGLSYYGDRTLSKRLAMDKETLFSMRGQLVQTGLYCLQRSIVSGTGSGR